MAFSLYDFVDEEGASIIALWRTQLTRRGQAALDNKLHMLQVNGSDLGPKLLAGPINKTQHVYKLIIHADVMLRPMLCKGPFDLKTEFTLLCGAKEVQGKLVPGPEVAVENRSILLGNKKRRKSHVW